MNRVRDRFGFGLVIAALVWPAGLLPLNSTPFLLAMTNSTKAGLLTGLAIIAILTGTVGIGTIAAYTLHRTSGKKGTAIAVLALMILCAVVIAATTASTLYITISAWLGRDG